jgi:hypothetical protein
MLGSRRIERLGLRSLEEAGETRIRRVLQDAHGIAIADLDHGVELLEVEDADVVDRPA